MRKSLLVLGLTSVLRIAPAYAAESVSQQQFQALEARIARIEADNAALRKQSAEAIAAAQAAQSELAQLKSASTVVVAATAEEDLAAPAADADTELAASDGPAAAAADSNNTAASANAFNPAISIILNGSYSHHSLDPDGYVRAGFPAGAGPGPQGLSLGESEVSFAANIDDKLYGQLTVAVESEDGEDQLGVEEAFVDTTALPNGFSLRAGRFFSNIGYLNSHHAHTDSFFDRPLAYQAFLGDQYGDDGLQLRWVAPTSMFLELGGEVFRGQNFPSGGAGHGGVGVKTAFAHVGGDVGTDSSWLAGVSMLKSRTEGADDGFSGDNTLYVADGTWKWAPEGNFKDGGITLRGEYFLDKRDGVFMDPQDPDSFAPWIGDRRGAYLESVYRFNRTWDVGYRYDHLWADDSGPFASDFDPFRHSMMLTWRNSEFSLVRLQLSHDRPDAGDSDNAVTVQYQSSLGAHGAHKF